MNKNNTRLLVTAAMFIALDIIATRFLGFELPTPLGPVKFDFQVVVAALCGYALGPFWAPVALVASDLVGVMINSGSLSFFPGFTVSALLRGLLFGLLLYKKDVKPLRLILAVCIVFISVDFALNTLWLCIITGNDYLSFLVLRILPKAILMVTECAVSVALIRLFAFVKSKKLRA